MPLRTRHKKVIGVFGMSIVHEQEIPSLNALENFTKVEKSILYWLVRGKTAKAIANILSRSPRTIEHHIENVKNKTGSISKSELIEKLIECGYVSR